MSKNGKVKLTDLARVTMALELVGAVFYRAVVHAQDKETKQRIKTVVIQGLVFRESDGKFLFTLQESLKCPAITTEQSEAQQKN